MPTHAAVAGTSPLSIRVAELDLLIVFVVLVSSGAFSTT